MLIKLTKATISLFLIISLLLLYIYYNTDNIANAYKKDLVNLISKESEVDLLSYQLLNGDFYNGFSFYGIEISLFSRYKITGDLVVKINFLDFIYSVVGTLFHKQDYFKIFDLAKKGQYQIRNFSLVDSNILIKAKASELTFNALERYFLIKNISIVKDDMLFDIETTEYSFPNYNKESYLSGVVNMTELSMIHQANKVFLADSINLSSFNLNEYKLKALQIKVPSGEELNIEEMLISRIEKQEQQEAYFDVYSINNILLIDSLEYSFNISASINKKEITINYLDVYSGDMNTINMNFRINFTDKLFLGTVKTSNLDIFGVKPEKASFNLSSDDFEEYHIKFSMYNVKELVKKKLSRLRGNLSLKCNTLFCSEYDIDFNENITISDKDYRGEFQIENIKDIDNFNLEVRSSFINIFKSNRLERIK